MEYKFMLMHEVGGIKMIEVTRLNDKKLIINADLIEKVEESPDTMITLTSGNKIIVKESRQEIKNLVILYKKEIFGREM
jgi:flagellar protein FlbD